MEAPAVLYHYASLDTLALILHKRTIRFSRLDKVDDPQEQRSADSQNLGKMKLVSCWTSSDEESIPMWREYAGAECGVRIQMKSYPFKQYSISNESLNMLSSEAVLNALGGSFDGLHLPLEDFWDKNYHFFETARDREILHEVEYTNDESLLFPKVINAFENGGLVADLMALGVHKTTAWSYQKEWRYILTAVPIGIDSVINVRLDQIVRANDVMLDKCDPGIPPYYDLAISDEAFSSMKIVSSPKMTPGNRVILDALIEKYAPGIEVAESSIELS
ncbi:DUF2971 domain-containing protein [Collinsella sp. CLA-AA-H167]|uniref:DUF2971 domain-containing protein n=1 Tax=Collinsella sp. CLA-AA-H167 TaxID=3136223 RepID=UPI0032C0A266